MLQFAVAISLFRSNWLDYGVWRHCERILWDVFRVLYFCTSR